MTKLRDYQRDALTHLRDRIEEGERRMYMSLPTGTGKTFILARLIAKARARGDRVAWVVHLRELVTQAAHMLEDATGETPGIVMADHRDVGADLVVGSVQSLENRRLHETLNAGGFDLMIVDEAHHATGANQYARLIEIVEEASSDLSVVGATATPYRRDRARMQDVLPVCAFERSIDDMQKAGVLCPLTWRPIRVRDLDLRHIRSGMVQGDRDFMVGDLAHEMSRERIIEDPQPLPLWKIGSRWRSVWMWNTRSYLPRGTETLASKPAPCGARCHMLIERRFSTVGVEARSTW